MNKIKINNIEVSEEELRKIIKDNPQLLKQEVKGRYFFPKIGEFYYYNAYDDCGLVIPCYVNYESDSDKYNISTGNCYRTKEEAQLAFDKQKALVRCWKWAQENAPFEPDWSDFNQKKYYIRGYNYITEDFFTDHGSFFQEQFTLPHFKSLENCEAFREACKEDLLLLYTK